MGDVAKAIIEVMAFLMPDSALGKIVGALLVLFAVFVVTGKFKLEWIGYGARHIFRWLRCKIRDNHCWRLATTGAIDLNTGRVRGTFVCSICGKVTTIT